MIQQLQDLAITLTPSNTGVPKVQPEAVMNGVLTAVYIVAGIACVIVLIVAGIFYATSDGDSSKIQTAKNAILYAVIGLVIIMMAFVITGFVAWRIG